MKRSLSVYVAPALLSITLGCSPDAPVTAKVSPKADLRMDQPAQPAALAITPDPRHFVIVTGPVTMEQQLDIVALRPGVIVDLPVDVDSEVQKNQIITRLDSRQLEADRNTAQHKVESLDADLKNWESELEVREADLRRAKEMRKEGINTQEALDHVQYEVTASKFEVERQRSDVLSARSNLQSLELELEKTRIVAPFRGVVSQRYVRLGQYVVTGDRLFRIIGTSPLEVRFTLPAADVALLRRGDKVTVSATPDFKRVASATVTHISPVVDPGSGTIEVTAVIANKLPELIPGSVASIRIASPK
jgi:RND family efflux transporter MFP subunit